MMDTVKSIIHCNTQEEVSACINKLVQTENADWEVRDPNIDPVQFELESQFFANHSQTPFFLIHVIGNDRSRIYWFNGTSADNIKQMLNFNADCYEATEFLNKSSFKTEYDIYDLDANLITTLKSPQDLDQLYTKVQEENLTYVSYINSQTIQITAENPLEYYQQIFTFD